MTRALRRDDRIHECGRTWEIEAARDGRLSGEARDALVRHVEQCSECRAQSDYVVGLGKALGELDAPELDDVAVRRLRQEVLGRVDAELAGRSLRSPRLQRVRVAVAALALALAAVVLVAFGALRWARVPAEAVVRQTTLDAVAEGDARWTRRTDGDVERVDLNDGTLRLEVHKTPGGRRVVVRVPDGEIEDLGTIFHVVVGHGRTERVGVDEGRVTLRLTNAAPVTISSGQTWERPAEASSMPAGRPTTQPTPVLASPAAAPPITSRPVHAVGPRPAVSVVTRTPPANAAQEDGAYLHAIQLLREGRESEAKAAARDYLRRFPDGFRREEMGRIAE